MSVLNPRLPAHLCLLIQVRLASTASSQGRNPAFPFPKHPNPTPYEIFHLPRGASQNAIKSRYYDLVRIYHPDRSPMPSSTAHSRFQAISDAYAILSGKKLSRQSCASDVPYEVELLRRKRAQWRASASSDEFGRGGYGANTSMWEENRERWNLNLLVFVALFTIVPISMLSPFVVNNLDRGHEEARKNLANARREARERSYVAWMERQKDNRIVRKPDTEVKVDKFSGSDANPSR